MELVSEKQFEKAVAEFDKEILLDPKVARAYNNRGYVYVVREHPEGCHRIRELFRSQLSMNLKAYAVTEPELLRTK